MRSFFDLVRPAPTTRRSEEPVRVLSSQALAARKDPPRAIGVSCYTIPTDFPESGSTLEWNSTTLVVVRITAGDKLGLGYTYANASTAMLIQQLLAREIIGRKTMDIPSAVNAIVRSVRNLGRPGIASIAISAVDVALWDLKAKLLDLPLIDLLGAARGAVPVYGGGGFPRITAIVMADGFSCKGQIEQETSRHGLHLAEVLQMAKRGVAGERASVYPEKPFVEARKAAQRKSMIRAGLIALGATLAITGLIWKSRYRN